MSTYDNQPPLLFSHEKHSTSYYATTTTTTTTDNKIYSSSSNIVKPCNISNKNRLSSNSSSGSDGSTRNKPFHDTVTNSIFYYMDKFVIITVKASIYMYTYTLQNDIDGDNSNNNSSNSIRRRNSSSSSIYDATNKILNHDYYCGNYRLLHKWDLSSKTHNICAMACLNSTLSPYVFCSTTNK